MQKTRLFGHRPLCFAAISIAIGILVGAICLNSITAIATLFAVTLLVVLIIFFLKPIRKFLYLAVFLFIGFILLTAVGHIYERTTIKSGSYEIYGQIESEITQDSKFSFTISNITIDGQSYGGLASVYFDETKIDFSAGDYVKIDGYLLKSDMNVFDKYFATKFVKKKYYTIYTSSCKLSSEGELNLIGKTELKVKQNFYENCRSDTADIVTALIFGDKSTMNDNLYEDIKVSGLAHTLAVSGLHISILSAFFYLILKKLKVKPLLRFIIIGILLFIYLIFCDFAASAVRAFIMSLCFMLAPVLGEKHDSLSSLGLACIIIMLVNPVNLFSVGFLLSVTAVLGIFMFYKTFKKLLKRDNKLTSIVATSISANIMTYPIMAGAFESFSVFFIFSNILVLPLMSFMYIGAIFMAFITLIIPIPQILVILDYLIIPLKAVALLVGSVAISSIPVASLGIMGFGYYTSATILSRYVFMRRDYKIKIALITLSVCLFLATVAVLLGG